MQSHFKTEYSFFPHYDGGLRLKICQLGEMVLRQKARTLSREEILGSDIQRLIEYMRETMRDAPGVGLAAPQVGLSLQIAVIEDAPSYIEKMPPGQAEERGRVPVPFHVVINPKLTLREGPPVEFFEGCLSLAGFSAVVPRAPAVHVDALNEKAEPISIDASGWYARILQHEIDHLNGIVYVDRMRSRTLMSIDNHARYWKDLPTAEILNRLGSHDA
ncbi:MAG TPA: peptide deformylase [Bryobacteraceae bacterium]